MSLKTRSTTVDPVTHAIPLYGPVCRCRVEFFRQEFLQHRECLERQREYYSEVAMKQAENALTRILQEIEQLCQRDDACGDPLIEKSASAYRPQARAGSID